ncbi:MAG: hypothetical protein ABIO70_13855 [Pseudomonadota bacterium]
MVHLSAIACIAGTLCAGPAEAGVLTAAEVCPAWVAGHPGVDLRLLFQGPGGEVVFFGRDAVGAEVLVQTVPTAIAGSPPACESWAVGVSVARVTAALVPGAGPGQAVTLHLSDPRGALAVVVARDRGGEVLAAGPFYLFGPVSAMEVLDMGEAGTFVLMGAERPEARTLDEYGVAWHDIGVHLLAARDGLVREVGKSVVLAPHWRDAAGRACRADPPVAPLVLDGGEPRIRMLDAPDVPGWGGRLLEGAPFEVELLAYPWRWREELGAFLVAPPMRHERVPWRVEPVCAGGG